MSTTHKFSPEYKTEIVLAMLREDDDITGLSEKYQIPVKQLRIWKQYFLEHAVSIFSNTDVPSLHRQINQLEGEISIAYQKIGELTMKIDSMGRFNRSRSMVVAQENNTSSNNVTMPRYLARLFEESNTILSSSTSTESFEANIEENEDNPGVDDEPDSDRQIKCNSPPMSGVYAMKNPYPIPSKIQTYFDSLTGDTDDLFKAMALYDNFILMPWLGRKKRVKILRIDGIDIGADTYYRHFNAMGLKTVCPTTRVCKRIPVGIPYLLRGKAIWLPNQVWAIDTTYIRLHHGFLYLTAVIDWYSRRIVGWDLSESLVTSGPIRAIENAMNDAGVPAIINSDQGSQFKSFVFQRFLQEHHIRQSMCDKARYVDNIMIERWFRSFKTELIYVQNFDSPKDARRQIRNYIDVYNSMRPHNSLGDYTPDSKFFGKFNRNYDFAAKMKNAEKVDNVRRKALTRATATSNLPSRQVFFPQNVMEQIIKEYRSGVPIFQLSKKYKHAHTTIQRALKKCGIEKYVPPLKYDPDEVIELYRQKYTIRQIGAKYKVAPRTISAFLKSKGIPVVKNPGGYVIDSDNGYRRTFNNRNQQYQHK